MGLVVHGMAGFDYDAAHRALGRPDAFRVEAMIAVGRPARVDTLDARLRSREAPSERRSIDAFAFEGALPGE